MTAEANVVVCPWCPPETRVVLANATGAP